MSQKKILFIGAASGLGDRLMNIPKLLELRKQGYHITFLCYEPSYFILFYNVDELLEIYKKNNLYDELLWIPRNKFKLIGCILTHLFSFDEAFTPVHTFFSSLLGRLFAKKYSYAFASLDSKGTGPYTTIIEGMVNRTIKSLFEYKKLVHLDYSNDYKTTFLLHHKRFATLFVSLCSRCMPPQELVKVIQFLNQAGLTVVLVGGDREKWITNEIQIEKYDMLNLLGKTSFLEVSSILSDAVLNISMDGGLMRLGHLMNKHNISIQNSTFFIIQAPTDNIHSFNLRNYTYPCCTPCGYFGMQDTYRKHGIKKCVFYGTDREGECRFVTKGEHLIYLIKKVLHQ